MRHRNAVGRLVLIDAAGFPMKLPVYLGLFNNALVRMSAPWCLPEAIISSAVCNVYGDPRKIAPEVMRRYVEFFHAKGTREAIGKMVPTLDFADLDTDVMKSLDLPKLVLWGALDRWIPQAHAAEFTHHILGAHSVMYDRLGHIPMEEAPQRVLHDLRMFFAKSAANSNPLQV